MAAESPAPWPTWPRRASRETLPIAAARRLSRNRRTAKESQVGARRKVAAHPRRGKARHSPSRRRRGSAERPSKSVCFYLLIEHILLLRSHLRHGHALGEVVPDAFGVRRPGQHVAVHPPDYLTRRLGLLVAARLRGQGGLLLSRCRCWAQTINGYMHTFGITPMAPPASAPRRWRSRAAARVQRSVTHSHRERMRGSGGGGGGGGGI